MKRISALLALAVISLNAFAETPLAAPSNPHAGMTRPFQVQGAVEVKLTQKAKVLSAINASQYTYLEVLQDKKTLWLASNTVAAKKNDTIRFDDGMLMTNFYSKTLKRTFPSIAFVNRVIVANEKN